MRNRDWGFMGKLERFIAWSLERSDRNKKDPDSTRKNQEPTPESHPLTFICVPIHMYIDLYTDAHKYII